MIRKLAVPLVVVALAAGCGGDDDDDDATSADETTETTVADEETSSEFDAYIGLTVDDAGAKADEEGRPWRVVEEDGEPMAVTQDFIEDRLNFVVVDGEVTAVTTG